MEYYITQTDYLSAQKEHLGKRGIVISIVCFIKACFIGVLLGLDTYDATSRFVLHVTLAAVVGILAACTVAYARYRSFRRSYARHKALHGKHTFAFDDGTFRFESDATRFSSTWRDVYDVKIGRDVVLIYEAKHHMRILPVAALREHGIYDDLVGVLTSDSHTARRSARAIDASAS